MGAGIGFVMPNLTTAIQNAVGRGELGGATAAAAFFRSLGGAIGVAASGAVLAAHLSALPSSMQAAGGVLQIASFAPGQRETVLAAYRAGLSGAFMAGAIIASAGFVLVLFLPELPLRGGSAQARPTRQALADLTLSPRLVSQTHLHGKTPQTSPDDVTPSTDRSS